MIDENLEDVDQEGGYHIVASIAENLKNLASKLDIRIRESDDGTDRIEYISITVNRVHKIILSAYKDYPIYEKRLDIGIKREKKEGLEALRNFIRELGIKNEDIYIEGPDINFTKEEIYKDI